MPIDYSKVTAGAEVTLTPEEHKIEEEYAVQMEEAYHKFAELHNLYDLLIEKEVDPARKDTLQVLLDQLREDNK